jgi:hypothetical protein
LFNEYDAVVSVENYNTEFAQILEFHPEINSPKDFGELRHSVKGGASGLLEDQQKRVHEIVDPLPVETRKRLKKYFGRDLTLFGYSWNTETNEIGFKYKD